MQIRLYFWNKSEKKRNFIFRNIVGFVKREYSLSDLCQKIFVYIFFAEGQTTQQHMDLVWIQVIDFVEQEFDCSLANHRIVYFYFFEEFEKFKRLKRRKLSHLVHDVRPIYVVESECFASIESLHHCEDLYEGRVPFFLCNF